MFQHLLIRQIRTWLDVGIDNLRFPLHECVQHSSESFHITRHRTSTVLVTGNRHKTVCSARQINLQPMCPVVNVIYSLVKNIVLIHMEKTAQTGSGRGPFKICVFEESQYGGCHIVQRAILTDTVVDVDCSDAGGYPYSDTIISAHGKCLHCGDKFRKRLRIIALGFLPCNRIIGNLGKSCGFSFSLFLFPYTKPA